MRTAQEIFDTVVAHLRQQNAQSLDPTKRYCTYRGENGMSCAVGCLLSEDVYLPTMEGMNISNLIVGNLIPDSLVDEFKFHERLLSGLQTVHDSYFPTHWEEKLKLLADRHHLQFTPKT